MTSPPNLPHPSERVETPLTDKAMRKGKLVVEEGWHDKYAGDYVTADFARHLERELSAERATREEADGALKIVEDGYRVLLKWYDERGGRLASAEAALKEAQQQLQCGSCLGVGRDGDWTCGECNGTGRQSQSGASSGRPDVGAEQRSGNLDNAASGVIDQVTATASGCPHPWTGPGEQPAKFTCGCGTLVYRSYEDYCDD